MEYSNIGGLGGQDNMGGLTQEIYYAPVSDFESIKGFKATTAPGDSVTIDGSHTFKLGKGFCTLYTTLDSSKLMAELTGERDGHGFNVKVEAFHPGGKKEAAEFARQAKNDQFIFLVKSPNGEVYQIGSKELYGEISGKYDTGTLGSGRNGWTFTLSSYANGLSFYEGTITMKP